MLGKEAKSPYSSNLDFVYISKHSAYSNKQKQKVPTLGKEGMKHYTKMIETILLQNWPESILEKHV